MVPAKHVEMASLCRCPTGCRWKVGQRSPGKEASPLTWSRAPHLLSPTPTSSQMFYSPVTVHLSLEFPSFLDPTAPSFKTSIDGSQTCPLRAQDLPVHWVAFKSQLCLDSCAMSLEQLHIKFSSM